MSENSDDLPPARARPRPAGRDPQDPQQQRGPAQADRTPPRQPPAVQERDDDEEIEATIRSAFRLSDYVSNIEDRDTLAQLKDKITSRLGLSPDETAAIMQGVTQVFDLWADPQANIKLLMQGGQVVKRAL